MIEIRNPRYMDEAKKIVDVDIKLDENTVIPYTFIYDQKDEMFDVEVRKYLKTASIKKYIKPEQKLEQVVQNLTEIIEFHVQKQINIYNEINKTMFSTVHNCATYKDIETYSHQKFCKDIVIFNAKVWEKGRILQAEIEDGKREVLSEDEFISLLPEFVYE